jgi:hypothetical protein
MVRAAGPCAQRADIRGSDQHHQASHGRTFGLSFFTRFGRLATRGRTTAEDDLMADGRLERMPGDDGPDDDGPDDDRAGDDGARDPAASRPEDDVAGDPAGDRRGQRPVAARVTTALACLLVLFALIAPNQVDRLTPAAFVRIPLEGLLAVPLVLILPARARRVVAVLVGVALGLLTIVKIIDMGFFAVLARPFDPVFDWPSFGAAMEFLTSSIGRVGAIGSVVAAVVLAVALLILMALSVLRLTRLVVRHNTMATRAAAVLGTAWIACAVLGAQIVPGVPVASKSAADLTYDRTLQVHASLQDHKAFAAQAAVDAFRDTPGNKLLTGLRGKDVIVTFVESYGRDAIEDPAFAPQVGAVLAAGDRRLRAAGFASRSAFLTSPTVGGGSWLAHGTLLSGLWVDNQQRYHSLVTSHRLTLNTAFRRAGWRTVAVMPGNTRAWPEGAFYGYDRIYDRWNIGYRGPRFNWGMPPDQYTLASFERSELATPHHTPVMAEIPLVSSHAPWAPTPSLIDWHDVGDGSVFGPQAAAGDSPNAVWRDAWRDPTRVRAAYRGSIEYSLNALLTYVETYGNDNLVLVFLGDHQPAPIVTGEGASRDVPITIVARDRAVLDRISGWGWQDGLKPGPRAPVWQMSAFRDRFLTAFGPQAPPHTR